MKLHLGCGQRYLQGYVNIDYPLSEHTVQQKAVADEFADLLKLSYPEGSIDEVRLHHVFEHFSRPVSCAMLTKWNSWLKKRGVLHIEVPDFERTGKAALGLMTSSKLRAVARRHIFGSQEAHWANHYEGYSGKTLRNLLKTFGFDPVETRRNDYKGTYNVEVIAGRTGKKIDFSQVTRTYLSDFLLDDSETEKRLLDTWMDIYKKHL